MYCNEIYFNRTSGRLRVVVIQPPQTRSCFSVILGQNSVSLSLILLDSVMSSSAAPSRHFSF